MRVLVQEGQVGRATDGREQSGSNGKWRGVDAVERRELAEVRERGAGGSDDDATEVAREAGLISIVSIPSFSIPQSNPNPYGPPLVRYSDIPVPSHSALPARHKGTSM
jgi:hypothetical protein